MEYAMVGATIVKVHRRGQGAKGGLGARPSANGYRALWAAQGEADARTVVDTARLKPGTRVFRTILRTVSA